LGTALVAMFPVCQFSAYAVMSRETDGVGEEKDTINESYSLSSIIESEEENFGVFM